MPRWARFSAAIALTACLPGTALADEPRTQASTEITSEVWYGWQTLLLDTASLAFLAGGIATDASGNGEGFFYASVAAYASPPIVHMAHGHVGKAFGDFGLRLGLPLLFVIGGFAAGGQNIRSQLAGAVVGGLTGLGAASAIDAAWLARETVSVEPTTATGSMTWSPRLALTPSGGASVGVGGSF